MRKTALLIAALAAYCVLAEVPSARTSPAAGCRLKVVATAFPVYDWTRQVLGDLADSTDLVLLQQNGVDMHSYNPTAADLRKIAACDLFMFVGGESDEWAGRALAQGGNPRRRALNLIKTLGPAAKTEKTVEGMDHDILHRHGAKMHGRGHEDEIDEHVWLSLRHAVTLVKAIASELEALDPANAATYAKNAAAYCEKLAALDGACAKTVSCAKRKTILVADRFPFRYFADDYGLTCFAAFSGCSAESEASFKTIAFLSRKVDELNLPVILTMEGSQHKIAETVKRTTKNRNQRILALDSLQSTDGKAASTARYLDAMAHNLDVLKAALN